VAIGVLAAVGGWMVLHGDEGESEQVDRLVRGRGLVLIAIGVSISLDELAIGFTVGLLHLVLWLAVVLIGVQAFVFSQLGLRLGAHLNERLRERAEQVAGLALLAVAALLTVEKFS
jgi:manganese efflux pump family protein